MSKKLVHLPGTRLSAEVVLHRTFEKLPSIKSVAVVIQWDDGTYDVDWSSMKTSEMCMAAMMLHDTAVRCLSPQETDISFKP